MRIANLLRSRPGLFLAIAAAATVLFGAAAQAQRTDGEVDPPGRVGRISYLSGPVQLIDARSGQGEPATLNWPITSGLRLATGRLGRAEVRIGSLALRIDDDTEVEFTRIDDEAMHIATLHGSVAIRIRNREHLRELDLLTPRDRIVIEDVGRYRIDVDRAPAMTTVTAYFGQARILSGRLIFTVPSGQRGELEAAPVTSFRLGAPMPDPFDDWVATRERRDEASRSAQYVTPEMTGVESLDEHGAWRTVESYGPVWFPSHVPTGWVPYRYGRWGYIAPWGWTWIDEAPWGFAPSHYGRWAFIGGGWGWMPGMIAHRPVFAPALVAWFGRPGFNVSIGIGAPIGWFPLGPGEVFIPGYPCSRRHVDIVNVPHVVNITNITVINPPPRYVHRDHDRATWAPGDALFKRGPIQRVVQPPPADWQNHAATPRPPIEPPRDIKKRPTPVPMPGRDVVPRGAPESPRVMTPATPGAAQPPAPAQSVPRPDEPRPRHPRAPLPAEPSARIPAPINAAPAAPIQPVPPRAVPADERRRTVPPSDDAQTRARRPTPAAPPGKEPVDNGARAREHERIRPRVAPTQPQVVTPSAPVVMAPAHGRNSPRPVEERASKDSRRPPANGDHPNREGKGTKTRE